MILYIRTVILVKTIICDEWTLHNKLRASMLIKPSVRAAYLVFNKQVYSRLYIAGRLFL